MLLYINENLIQVYSSLNVVLQSTLSTVQVSELPPAFRKACGKKDVRLNASQVMLADHTMLNS